jgi:hypothetical protein
MFNEHSLSHHSSIFKIRPNLPRNVVLGLILLIALFAFELFNFDTTRFALRYLLGDVSFLSLGWATILAVAFCAIDFAGLARMFTPEQGADEPNTVWYLMGAWLLGATMNALMTWWAVSLTLLSHEFGNEVLSRDQLLQIVPIFVAALVWLTRILFIGALSVTGEQLFRAKPVRATESEPRHSQQTARNRRVGTPPLKIARSSGTSSALTRPGPSPSADRRQRPTRDGRLGFPAPRPTGLTPAGMHARSRRR